MDNTTVYRRLRKALRPVKRFFLGAQPSPAETNLESIDQSQLSKDASGNRLYKCSNYSRLQQFRSCGFVANTFTHRDREVLLIENVTHTDELPLPPQELMEYGETAEWHLKIGKRDFNAMKSLLANHGVEIEGLSKVLEFGCSNGRILRNFVEQSQQNEYWGCDINSDSVFWCIENLSPPFHFFVNTTSPHLPIDSGYFSFVYCYSIFTHIDDLFFSWILELKRVIAQSGYLFLSIHDENSVIAAKDPEAFLYPFYKQNEVVFEQFMTGEINYIAVKRDFNSQVFVRREYFLKTCERYFEVVGLLEYTMGGHQTAVLLKKR